MAQAVSDATTAAHEDTSRLRRMRRCTGAPYRFITLPLKVVRAALLLCEVTAAVGSFVGVTFTDVPPVMTIISSRR